MKKVVSASEVRTKFGEIMNLAYYQGVEFIVEKMGKPVVKITKVEDSKNSLSRNELISRFAGVWSNEEVKEIKKNMRKFRKNFKLIP